MFYVAAAKIVELSNFCCNCLITKVLCGRDLALQLPDYQCFTRAAARRNLLIISVLCGIAEQQ
jgi:hypothetical protein